jgi:hypothetical protein
VLRQQAGDELRATQEAAAVAAAAAKSSNATNNSSSNGSSSSLSVGAANNSGTAVQPEVIDDELEDIMSMLNGSS